MTSQQASIDIGNRVRLTGISPRAYEHPADRGAMATLRAVPGAADVLKALSGVFPERGEHLWALGSAVRVGGGQYPAIAQLRDESAVVLDLPEAPDLFVMRSAEAQAMAIGIEAPFVLLTTGLVDALDTEALRFVIGHELGHVLSGHAFLRTLLLRLLTMQVTLSWIPAGALGIRAVIAALLEWFRKAELTADRAGLLCSQDPAAALRAHVSMAGGTSMAEIDLTAFLNQAEEYLHTDDIRDSIHKLRNLEMTTHPLAVVRAAHLQRWAASEEYRAILGGTYPRREDDKPHADFLDDIVDAAKSYKDAAAGSADPVVTLLNAVGEQVAKAGRGLGDVASRVFRRGGEAGRGDGSEKN